MEDLSCLLATVRTLNLTSAKSVWDKTMQLGNMSQRINTWYCGAQYNVTQEIHSLIHIHTLDRTMDLSGNPTMENIPSPHSIHLTDMSMSQKNSFDLLWKKSIITTAESSYGALCLPSFQPLLSHHILCIQHSWVNTIVFKDTSHDSIFQISIFSTLAHIFAYSETPPMHLLTYQRSPAEKTQLVQGSHIFAVWINFLPGIN